MNDPEQERFQIIFRITWYTFQEKALTHYMMTKFLDTSGGYHSDGVSTPSESSLF